jgi:hypothetical protein
VRVKRQRAGNSKQLDERPLTGLLSFVKYSTRELQDLYLSDRGANSKIDEKIKEGVRPKKILRIWVKLSGDRKKCFR